MTNTQVMPRAVALEYVGKFAELGLPALLRPRSFNKDRGTDFWAIEVGGKKLYSAAAAEEKLLEFVPPIPVKAEIRGSYFTFPKGDGTYLHAPDNDYLWTVSDVVAETKNGKPYLREGKRYLLLPPVGLFHTA